MIRVLIIVTLFFINIAYLFPFALDQAQADAIQWYENAIFHKKRGEMKKAESCLQNSLKFWADYPEANAMYRELTGKGMNASDEALDLINSIDLDLTGYETSYDLVTQAFEEIKSGNYHKALAFIYEIKKDAPTPFIFNTAGYCYEKLGKIQKAFENYKKAYESEDGNQVYMNNYFNMLIQTGGDEKDMEILALKLKGFKGENSKYAFDTLGMYYHIKGDFEKAGEQYKKAQSGMLSSAFLKNFLIHNNVEELDLKNDATGEKKIFLIKYYLLNDKVDESFKFVKEVMKEHPEFQKNLEYIALGGYLYYLKKNTHEFEKVKEYFSNYFPESPFSYFFNALSLHNEDEMENDLKLIVKQNLNTALLNYPNSAIIHHFYKGKYGEGYNKTIKTLNKISFLTSKLVGGVIAGTSASKTSKSDSENAASKSKIETKEYINSVFSFGFNYPVKWKVTEDTEQFGLSEAQCIVYFEHNDDEDYKSFITYVITVNDGSISLEDMLQANEDQLQQLTTYEKREENKLEIGGMEGYERKYKYDENECANIFLINDDYIVVVTYITKDEYVEKMKPDYEIVTRSFSFKE